jgi:hypothetical protein
MVCFGWAARDGSTTSITSACRATGLPCAMRP